MTDFKIGDTVRRTRDDGRHGEVPLDIDAIARGLLRGESFAHDRKLDADTIRAIFDRVCELAPGKFSDAPEIAAAQADLDSRVKLAQRFQAAFAYGESRCIGAEPIDLVLIERLAAQAMQGAFIGVDALDDATYAAVMERARELGAKV